VITFISGAPGTGKTSALVSMLRDLGRDRPVYCFGIPELKVPHIELVDPQNWHNDVPDGAVVVIDEVQNVWRPRGPGQKVPEHVAKLETHRHRGLDFYIISQGPNLVDGNVRALIGRHVHLRELGVLGRWWYEWPECADSCRTAWKNAPIKRRYRLPKAIFKDYKSASLHVKPVRSFPWMLVVMVAALIALGVLCWRLYATVMAKSAPAPAKVVAGAATAQPGVVPATSGAGAPGATRVIDDRVDWIPRVSTKPESAPAFDELRKVVAMPRVAGAMVMGARVRCVTQQGTDAGLSEAECRAWLANPPFDPYRTANEAQPPLPSPGSEKPPEAAVGPTVTVIGDPGAKPSPVPAKRS
jgi:zona occludens toxin